MALKLNIRPEIEAEMEGLLGKSPCRSKTEYINRAIEAYNEYLKRSLEINKLREYFKTYQQEGKEILDAFGKVRKDGVKFLLNL